MKIRQFLNTHPRLSAIISFTLLATLIVYTLASVHISNSPHVEHQAFFTVDDGRTLFTDDISKFPPFLKDGQEAVRAMVFTDDGGKTQWIGYLEKYDESDKQLLETNSKYWLLGRPLLPLVKKPGSDKWVSQLTNPSKVRSIMSPVSPEHPNPATEVLP
jgi:hypothetical protein